MPKEPIITGNFKGMAVIQVFKNNSINNCTSISKWIQIDQEIMDSMMTSNKETKYIETENNGNVIKLFDESKSIKNIYQFNARHGLYLSDSEKGSVECLNLIDWMDESEDTEQNNEQTEFSNFMERFSEKSEKISFGRNSFTIGNYEETIDGIFIFYDIFV